MKKYYLITILLLSAVFNLNCQDNHPVGNNSENESVPLLRDVTFSNGFIHMGNDPSHVTNILFQTKPNIHPEWKLGQWQSKYVLTKENMNLFGESEYVVENNANSISVAKGNDNTPVITISASGRKEWEEEIIRKPGDPWPHMLLIQEIENCPTLDKIEKLQFKADVRITNWQLYHEELYNPQIHAARFRLNFIVKNVNKDSEGFNDYFWFVMTFFDNRHEFMPQTENGDTNAPGKFIYGADAKLYLGKSLHELEWVSIDKDILPLLKDGLQRAQANHFLPESDRIEDYSIRSFNFGYELTGSIDIESQLKNLDVIAITHKNVNSSN